MEKGEGVIGIREIEGKGRAVIASKALKAGQIVLRDSPLLVYSALPFVHHYQANSYCSHCFRVLQPSSSSSTVACTSCSYLFCSQNCFSIALSTSHTPWSCQTLIRFRRHYQSHHPPQTEPEPEERQVQARFLVAAYNLSMVSPSSFHYLLSLQGGGGGCPDSAASRSLHSLISSLFPPPLPPSLSLELTSLLLVKDKLNAFGLMEPFTPGKVEERSVRGYGIYPHASFFNHDCLPNACRFDYLDAPPAPPSNTCDIIIRLIHDVPMGREICLSYFPVNLNYSQRQRRLQDDYGFTCDCDRCKVEANWSDGDDHEDVDVGRDDDINNDKDEDTADMDEDSEVHMVGSDTGETDFPHAYFFLRYMCDTNNCWGTLAPLPPSGLVTSSMLECNVCGNLKSCDED